MSKKSLEKITCPVCHKKQDFVIWNSVNIFLDPEMKEKVIDRSVFDLTCIKCGTSTLVQYPLLYHDQRNNFMIWLIPGEEDNKPPEIPQDIIPMPGEYRLRVVKTINRLIEKIFILDSKLDDRAIEIIKYLVWKERLKMTVSAKDIFFSNAFMEENEIAITLEMINKNGNHSSMQVGGKSSDFPVKLDSLFAQTVKEQPGWQWIDFNFPTTLG